MFYGHRVVLHVDFMTVEIWEIQAYGWKGGGQKSSKLIDIVSYALEISVNGITCVFVVHFRSIRHISSL